MVKKRMVKKVNSKNTQLEQIKKHLNTMARTVTNAFELINALRETDVRLSKRIGDLEDKLNDADKPSQFDDITKL